MLVDKYTTESVRISCGSESANPDLVIHFDRDISEVIPYCNTVFSGFQYTRAPRSVSCRLDGKLVVIHPFKICVSSPGDKSETEKFVQWLLDKINDTWEKRGEITPGFDSPASPQVLEILKRLPRTNCGLCGEKTCMVFASLTARGDRAPGECPPLEGQGRAELEEYLSQFQSRS